MIWFVVERLRERGMGDEGVRGFCGGVWGGVVVVGAAKIKFWRLGISQNPHHLSFFQAPHPCLQYCVLIKLLCDD